MEEGEGEVDCTMEEVGLQVWAVYRCPLNQLAWDNSHTHCQSAQVLRREREREFYAFLFLCIFHSRQCNTYNSDHTHRPLPNNTSLYSDRSRRCTGLPPGLSRESHTRREIRIQKRFGHGEEGSAGSVQGVLCHTFCPTASRIFWSNKCASKK